MILKVLLFTLVTLSATESRAQEPTAPQVVAAASGTDSYILLGKGYANKDDLSDRIALACIEFDENQLCKTARFVRWTEGQANYIGCEIPIIYKENSKRIKVDTKAMKSTFKKLFISIEERREKAASNRRLALLSGGIGAALGWEFGPWVRVGSFVYAAGMVALSLVFQPNEFIFTTPLSFDKMDRVTRDRDGWNWSNRPKGIREKVFNQLIADLKVSELYNPLD